MKIKSLLKASKYIILHPLRSWRVFTPKTKKRLKKLLAVILIVLISIPGYLWYEKKYGDNIPEAEAGWWNDGWMYRKAITVSNSSGGALTDFQVKILDNKDLSADITAGKIQSDLDDLRFTDINGTVLPYWIEDNTAASVDVWVKMPSIPTTGATVYFYYGNAQAGNEQNGNNVFEFFDDFSGATIDTGLVSYGGGTITQNDYLTVVNNADAWDEYVYTNQTFAREKIFYAKVKADQGARTMVGWHDSGMGVGYGDQVYALYFNSGSFSVYEDGASKGVVGSYTVGTWYDVKIELKTTGAVYCYKLPTDSSWTTLYTSTYSTEDNLKPSLTHYDVTETSYTENWLVSKYASSLPSASTPATEEKGGAPVAHWSFDEGTGTTTNDLSSNRNNGTLTNMASTADPNSGWQSEDKCVSGKCLAFDNVNDGVSINNQNFTSLNDYSMCSWINPKGNHLHYTGSIISSGDWNNVHWAFGVDRTNGVLQTRKADGVNSPSWSYTFPTNQWSYACITRSGTSILAYVNGKNIGSYTGVLGSIVSNATNTMIGRETYAGGYFVFNGQIDEPRIYNYARTPAQIAKDYNAGLSGMGKANEGTSASIGGKSNKWLTDGLVGHWKMDEASGNAIDSSGNGFTTTSVGTPSFTGGKFGNSVLTSSGSHNAGDQTAHSGLSSLTLSSWVYMNDLNATWSFIAGKSNFWSDNDYGLYTNGTTIGFFVDTGTDSRKLSTITGTGYIGGWHLWTAVYDGSTAKFYLDGEEKSSQPATGTINDTSFAFTIGARNVGDYNFSGKIDETRIYNRALSPKEVSDLYNYAPGPVGYWNLDDATGTTAKDLSGNGNNGTLTNGPTWTTAGKYGGAVSFDGTDDYIIISDSDSISLKNNFTFNAWIKPGSSCPSSYCMIFNKEHEYEWAISAGKIYYAVQITSPTWAWQDTGVTVNLDEWAFVNLVYDTSSQTIKLYKNGILVYTRSSSTGDITQSESSLRIGSRDAGEAYFPGLIDDVKIYNYARTQKQIVEDMNGGHSAGGSPVGSQVGYWKFDEGNGTTVANSGTNATATGVLTNGPTWTNDGKFGKALTFDGSDDYVNITSDSSLSGSLDRLSLTAWFKTSLVDTSQQWVAGNMSSSGGYRIMVYNNQIMATLRKDNATYSSVLTSASGMADGNWHYVAITYDKDIGLFKLYIDGKLSGTTSWSETVGAGNNLNIGRVINFIGAFNGQIDEVKFYSSALTDSEIQLDYNQGKSLVLGSKGTESDGKTPSNSASRAYCPPGNVEGNCAPGLNPAPVGEWSLDDGSGTTAKDKSGNNNTGTLTNGPTWVTNGKSGNALSFDGTDDYVNISSSTSMVTQNAITVEGWVNRSNFVDADTLYVLGSQSSTLGYHWLYLYSNSINWQYAYTTSYRAKTATYTFNNDTWYHIAVTHDYTSGSINFYVNGQLISQQSQGTDVPVPVSGKSSKIGTYSGSSHIFQGLIDEVKIYNYARTPAQIAWDYNRGAPVGWWRMDEGQGTTAHDYSGNGNNGTLTNMDPATDWVAGKNNGALDFDGVNDYVNTASINFPLSGNFSVTSWVKPISFGTGRMSIFSQSNNNNYFELEIGTFSSYINTVLVASLNNIAIAAGPNNSISLGQWQHITYVKNPDGTNKIYINGSSQPLQLDVTNGFSSGTSNKQIGQRGNDSQFFNGSIDDVRIYNYALSAEQVKQIYNNGAVNFK
mgnify:CR=1 FL=1